LSRPHQCRSDPTIETEAITAAAGVAEKLHLGDKCVRRLDSNGERTFNKTSSGASIALIDQEGISVRFAD
jgi:hypothetical protein